MKDSNVFRGIFIGSGISLILWGGIIFGIQKWNAPNEELKEIKVEIADVSIIKNQLSEK